ncbi:hypothetical protein [Halomonas elongata]|uniref:Chromosome segregation protein n=1 Tax=Halomonas elongata TaxID=2746 RepID=A0A1B8P2I0_HALEL|nr:hypothetical protein [Halomonas elongata]OBX36393.1 chromosome segregation protein [Halomonas elongata]
MAERPEDSRFNRPIVPDPDASLAGHRGHSYRRVRLWPLWCLILLLVLMLAGLAAAGWLFHQDVQQRLTRLGGELSNVHARFDAEQGRGEALASLEERLETLETRQASVESSIEERLTRWEDEVLAPIDTRLEELSGHVATLSEEAEVRDKTLSAVRNSLDALERAGEEGRGTLQEHLATLEDALEANESRLTEQVQRSDERFSSLSADLQALDERLSGLEGDIEALSGSREDARSQVATLSSRLEEMQTELRDLRQTQLALSAQLEALR